VPWTIYVLSLHVIWSICTPIALVECMFPDRRTEPWLRKPGLIIVAVVYVLGVVAAFATTWATFRYVAEPSRLIGAAIVAVVLIIIGMLLTSARRPERSTATPSRRAPAAWVVGVASAVAASLVVLAPHLPIAVLRTLTILLIDAVAIIAITMWSRRPGWGSRQILALAAGTLFAYAWHAFVSPPAFDSAPLVIVRISHMFFAALAAAAVWIATRRISAAERT
jgi:glucose uptake protein GlcU